MQFLMANELRSLLGTNTSVLTMRFGLDSGPITAGVLRGEKSRFQLFGDTVNTAARMWEHWGKSEIKLSKNTADLLVSAGKGTWIEKPC